MALLGLIFDTFRQILVAMRRATCDFAFYQRKKAYLHAPAREPWLTVYRARSGGARASRWRHLAALPFCVFRGRTPLDGGRSRPASAETLIASCSICGAILNPQRDTARMLMLSLLGPLHLMWCVAFCCFGVIGAEGCSAWRRMCAYVEC